MKKKLFEKKKDIDLKEYLHKKGIINSKKIKTIKQILLEVMLDTTSLTTIYPQMGDNIFCILTKIIRFLKKVFLNHKERQIKLKTEILHIRNILKTK